MFTDASAFIDELASEGRYHFTTEEAAEWLGSSLVATRAALRRLRHKRLIAMPYRGFFVIVPAEYRRLGCLPADQFVPLLMEHLGLGYYAAILTAGRYHGAAHQQPQVFQVMVPKNRAAIICGQVRVAFVARRNVSEMPVTSLNTPRGHLAVSTPEVTAFDLVGYLRHAGGLDNVATVLTELAESLDSKTLASIAELSPLAWSQRLGYLLDHVGARDGTAPLSRYVAASVRDTVPLLPGASAAGAWRDTRWKLAVNAVVEPDL